MKHLSADTVSMSSCAASLCAVIPLARSAPSPFIATLDVFPAAACLVCRANMPVTRRHLHISSTIRLKNEDKDAICRVPRDKLAEAVQPDSRAMQRARSGAVATHVTFDWCCAAFAHCRHVQTACCPVDMPSCAAWPCNFGGTTAPGLARTAPKPDALLAAGPRGRAAARHRALPEGAHLMSGEAAADQQSDSSWSFPVRPSAPSNSHRRSVAGCVRHEHHSNGFSRVHHGLDQCSGKRAKECWAHELKCCVC